MTESYWYWCMRLGGILQLTGNSTQLVLWSHLNVHHICTDDIVLNTHVMPTSHGLLAIGILTKNGHFDFHSLLKPKYRTSHQWAWHASMNERSRRSWVMIGKYLRKNTATREVQVHLGSNIPSHLQNWSYKSRQCSSSSCFIITPCRAGYEVETSSGWMGQRSLSRCQGLNHGHH